MNFLNICIHIHLNIDVTPEINLEDTIALLKIITELLLIEVMYFKAYR